MESSSAAVLRAALDELEGSGASVELGNAARGDDGVCGGVEGRARRRAQLGSGNGGWRCGVRVREAWGPSLSYRGVLGRARERSGGRRAGRGERWRAHAGRRSQRPWRARWSCGAAVGRPSGGVTGRGGVRRSSGSSGARLVGHGDLHGFGRAVAGGWSCRQWWLRGASRPATRGASAAGTPVVDVTQRSGRGVHRIAGRSHRRLVGAEGDRRWPTTTWRSRSAGTGRCRPAHAAGVPVTLASDFLPNFELHIEIFEYERCFL